MQDPTAGRKTVSYLQNEVTGLETPTSNMQTSFYGYDPDPSRVLQR
jgi:hypothetical protein